MGAASPEEMKKNNFLKAILFNLLLSDEGSSFLKKFLPFFFLTLSPNFKLHSPPNQLTISLFSNRIGCILMNLLGRLVYWMHTHESTRQACICTSRHKNFQRKERSAYCIVTTHLYVYACDIQHV